MSLKIKALCNLGLRLSKNPDVIIKAHETNGEILAMIDSLEITSVKYFNWKRVDDGHQFHLSLYVSKFQLSSSDSCCPTYR
jgi:hypothetical protein